MMVCPYDDEHVLLILQVDHSRVAGLLAAHWGNAEFVQPEPYSSMVVAAQEHDSGWWDWEIKPTVNADGYPMDYMGAGLGTRWLNLYRHGISRMVAHDPYAGLMVSMHGEGLMTGAMGLMPSMKGPRFSEQDTERFIREQHELWDGIVEKLKSAGADVDSDHIWRNFKYMEVFDQLAQFLCNRYPLNSSARKSPTPTLSDAPVSVRPGVPDTSIVIEVLNEARAQVRPYPFHLDPLEISFPARLVPNRPLSNEEFLREFHRARPFTVIYNLQSGA